MHYVLPLILLIFYFHSFSSSPSLYLSLIPPTLRWNRLVMWTSGHLAGFYMFLWPTDSGQSHSVPSQLARGVGLHHGGMLPVLREITEKFFKEWKHRLGCGCLLLKLFQPALATWVDGICWHPVLLPGGLDPRALHDRDVCGGGQHAQPLHRLQLGRRERVPQIRRHGATRDLRRRALASQREAIESEKDVKRGWIHHDSPVFLQLLSNLNGESALTWQRLLQFQNPFQGIHADGR